MTIIGYIIIGLLGGAIAKAIMPGREAGGWLSTMFLGIGGALLAGFLGQLIFHDSYDRIFSLPGLAFSVGGAVLILAIQGWSRKRR
ncbi:GlsB/YeaQ/YmgE family stress response membrane protein [Arachnia propionica]|uniref:GlsB/YeaQ/YmgE family stress response membrane protein n=1 Tax=Arachnia propionica TaxID=1750 RepID=A0A3P1TDP7_9ACTN|nr:GlsB/YeaQ/YmgE family stress response membrane protein [Arachnia propionica]MDO5082084.1 GlsB/YeaQ/YmgE family stress response membrane protein [Arachnia propionica]RRD06633.1 GlsB/YeaQ/YmgE family stress response membrane protein [Arachnia propionica]